MRRMLCCRTARVLAVLTMALPIGAVGVAAQTGTIAGRVTDADTGLPIPAAQVVISDLDIGVLTQQNGSYILLNVPVGSHVVSVERIGYTDASGGATVAAGETAVLDLRIREEALALDEIIVTGTPGATERRAIGNTVSTVEVSDVVQDVAVTDMQALLAGRTTGLQFTALTGSVGAGSPIQIRGVGSFSGSREQPLIYVDGVRVDNAADAGPTVGTGRQVSVLDDFNPEDIASIEIIKGPAAASLYGTEASAGVIQIITKKGEQGEPRFNISVRQGVNYMPHPASTLGTMWTCPTDPSPGPTDCENEEDLVPYNMYEEGTRYIQQGYFPWPTDDLFSYGHAQGYNLDVRGGADAIRYFLSANYDKDQGYVYFNTDETFRLRANVGVVFSDRFTLDVSTGYVDGFSRFAGATVSDGGIWQDLSWSNGYYLDRITAFDQPGANPRLGGFQEHLPTDVAEIEATRDYSRFTGSTTLNYSSSPIEFGASTASINSRLVVGIDKGWDTNRNLFPAEDHIVPANLTQYVDDWEARYSETVTGEMTYARPITSLMSFDYGLTADLQVGDRLGLATSFGAQYYVRQSDQFSNSGNGFASPLSTTINQLAQSQLTNSYSFVENKSLGFYLQEAVTLNDRIYLTGAMRFDDNSTFGVDAPALLYPKLSASWVVSDEGFWRVAPISSLRLRSAWGQAGRQPSALSGLDTYVTIPGPGGVPAIRQSSPGNPKIEPEVSTELELGFDIAMLDDRISGEFTHYWRTDDQQLLSIGVPSSFGIPGSVDQNLGRIDNWGWEAQVSARLYEGELASFDLDLSADHTDNEIVSLGTYPGTNAIRIGLPYPNVIIGDWVVSAEFDPTAPAEGNFTNAFGKRITALCDAGVSLAPDPDAANASQYGVVPGGEAVPCSEVPNRDIFVGRGFATHTFSVAPRIGLFDSRVQVYALAEGQYGRTNRDDAHAWGHIYNNSKVARLENDAFWVASDRLNGNGNDFGKSIYDADFWKLREIGARFVIPASLVGRVGASQASLALSGRNLWTIWQAQDEIHGKPVTDPEYGNPVDLGGGSNFYSVPPLASVNATLRVSF